MKITKQIGHYILASLLVFSLVNVAGAQTSTSSSSSQQGVVAYCGVSLVVVPNTTEFDIDWMSAFSNVTGTSTILQYRWTGSDGLDFPTSQAHKRYTTNGLKTGQIVVSGVTPTPPLNCSADVQYQLQATSTQNIGGSCQPSIFGMEVTWNSAVSGVNQDATTINWSGTDGLSGTTTVVKKIYTTQGIKTGTVTFSSSGRTIVLQCQALIAPNSSSGCFIATAAYGTYQEPEVQVLRNFRDETLLHSELGKEFVNGYYSVSPPIADFIREHDSLRAVVRAGLDPVILALKMSGYSTEK